MSNEQETPLDHFGFTMIRDELIPDLLGTHTKDILYWAGKNMARKYPCENEGELIAFFSRANWGSLMIIRQKNDEMHFELSGSIVEERLKIKESQFSLEAGFLAEQIAMMKQYQTEAVFQKEKKNKVQFELKSDSRDPYSLPSRKANSRV
ncbi:YslB family protein [Jeotgalibacillus aurantiacus]|uniref:YslB family protein n=1 Tax=Jeotgalibacillus aurantiacus TaxID=2763266 RepID=UPI001D0A4B15|nr:YslB family protein [Jeotgalibacillus aurantiacus]